jgi:hypothetical protein
MRGIFFTATALCATLLAPAFCSATDLSGTWSGTWQSSSTGHKGPLRAEFVRLDEARYEVFFQGRFFKVFPFRYSLVMTSWEEGGAVYLSGSRFLGRMFGTFSFQAAATDCEFKANYSSCKDSGCFTMTRCTVASSCSCNEAKR